MKSKSLLLGKNEIVSSFSNKDFSVIKENIEMIENLMKGYTISFSLGVDYFVIENNKTRIDFFHNVKNISLDIKFKNVKKSEFKLTKNEIYFIKWIKKLCG